jgi:hypothetical protein
VKTRWVVAYMNFCVWMEHNSLNGVNVGEKNNYEQKSRKKMKEIVYAPFIFFVRFTACSVLKQELLYYMYTL